MDKKKVKSWLSWVITQSVMVGLLVLAVRGVKGAENVMKLLIVVNFILFLLAFAAVSVCGDEVIRSWKEKWHVPVVVNYVYGVMFACALAWFGHVALAGMDFGATIIQSTLLDGSRREGGKNGESLDD